MERKTVQAGKDTLLGLADRSNPVDAIAELVWNGLDAEATEVHVTVSIGALGGPQEIIVTDNGHGMTYDVATDVFTVHGESWKTEKRFSAGTHRPLHGRTGRGRFLAYSIGERVQWRTVALIEGRTEATSIDGWRRTPTTYDFEGPIPDVSEPGTVVVIDARQDQKTAQLVDPEFSLRLTARLAPSLLALTDAIVTYRDEALDVRQYVLRTSDVPISVDAETLQGYPAPQLVVIEWTKDMKASYLFLCDDHGAVVTEYRFSRAPHGPVNWSAYLWWEGFRDPSLMGLADLHHPEIQHAVLIAAVDRALTDFLEERFEESRGRIIAEWKAEGVYPYAGEPSTVSDQVERELFDVVAVLASPAIGKETRQKKLSLRLLREAIRSEPTHLLKILTGVLTLTEDEQETLAELLERTHLGAIVQAAQTIADRSDFLRGLESLLYSNVTTKTFREIDQLHPILVQEPWVFGDEWALTLSESSLNSVVKSYMSELGAEAEFAPTPVRMPSGKSGRVDLVFHRVLPESDRTRHLVVELKRPMKLTMVEYGQLNNYATAITSHPQVAGATHVWDFWLVGTDVDDAVQNLWQDSNRPFLTASSARYRLWVVTWGMLLDNGRRRMDAFRRELDLQSTDESGRSYLRRKHSQFIPPEVSQ